MIQMCVAGEQFSVDCVCVMFCYTSLSEFMSACVVGEQFSVDCACVYATCVFLYQFEFMSVCVVGE